MPASNPVEKRVDKRLFLDKRNNVLFAANLKCGYSSLNNAVFADGFPGDFVNIANLEDGIDADTRTILFTRDPADRFLSFYANWVIDKDYSQTPDWGVLKIFQRNFSAAYFQELTHASAEEKATPAFLDEFIINFAPFVTADRHTAPQFLLYQHYGKSIRFFTDIIDFKENITLIKELYGVNLNITNKTNPGHKARLNTERLQAFCETVYGRDYKELFARS